MVHSVITLHYTLIYSFLTDPTREGMWLFDERIAQLRKKFSFIIKIDVHSNRDVSRREGRVLVDADALSHPLFESTPPDVFVEYTTAGGELQVEKLPVTSLRPTAKLRSGARLAVIKGEHIGKVVIHIKTDLDDARVYIEGTDKRKDAFRVSKIFLCIIE